MFEGPIVFNRTYHRSSFKKKKDECRCDRQLSYCKHVLFYVSVN